MTQDIESDEQNEQALALLKLLALGDRQIEEGDVYPVEDVINELRQSRQER